MQDKSKAKKQSRAKSKALPANTAENASGEVDKSIDKSINVVQAIKLRSEGRTYQEIADKFGVTRQAIHQKLQHIASYLSPEAMQAYEHSKGRALSVAEQVLLESIIDKAKLEKASLNNIAYAFQQVYSANRLEQGKATENIGVAMLLQDSQQARNEAEELRKALLEEE